MPPSPSRSQDAESQPRSPRSATTLIAVLIAAETAVCTTANPGLQEQAVSTNSIVPPLPVCESTANLTTVSVSPIEALGDELRLKVCTYLNWRDCLKMKTVSKAWNETSEGVVRMDTLPDTTTPTPAVFLTCPDGLVGDAEVEAQLRCQHPTKWRCALCGFCNSETRILCGNRACQIPCPTHRDCARLFLGQLRREGTVGTLKWLVEGVFGSSEAPVSIVNIENHRQLTTSRGKGCAWVYLQHRSMADSVLSHNHRVFFDVHPVTGREGVWIVGAGSEGSLQECVKVRGYIRGRDLLLPRNALVVEYPSRQPNQAWGSTATPPTYTAAANTAVGTSATPDANWYPATDSPPSESSMENQAAASTNSPNQGSSRAVRRHQPYGTPSWTPTAAGAPSMPTDFPALPPQLGSAPITAMTYYDSDAYFQHPDYDAYYASMAQSYYQAPPRGAQYGGSRSWNSRGYHHGAYGHYHQHQPPMYHSVAASY